jgi:hypothetical protein
LAAPLHCIFSALGSAEAVPYVFGQHPKVLISLSIRERFIVNGTQEQAVRVLLRAQGVDGTEAQGQNESNSLHDGKLREYLPLLMD